VMQGTQNKSITASISASPNPSHFFANARTKTVTIKGSTPNATVTVKAFKDPDINASATVILGSSGEGTASLSELPAGTAMSYSLTEAGKIESPRISDGTIPYGTITGINGGEVLDLSMQASGVTNKVKSKSSMTGTNCYLIVNNASYTGYVASANLVANAWVSPKTDRSGVNDLPIDAGTISYQYENADGNSSPEVTDGNIAPAPDSLKVHIDASGKYTPALEIPKGITLFTEQSIQYLQYLL
ncbi:MAG TPA: hypothetical protein PKW98_15490, partial [Candidatus Wallbacteria bacterium]|nr:hypothetical protein [Candidatus Wallbacteria bacterium]